ncbi:MAG: hypothetical protein WAO00_08415, partial [Chthoniobacterales bacterium]
MPIEYSAPLKAAVPAQFPFDSVLTALDEIVAQIGLTQIDYLTTQPAWANQPPGSLTPRMTEAEALALLGSFDDGPEIPAPTMGIPHAPLPTIALDAPTHSVAMHLKALSDVTIKLPGLEGVSLVVNPGHFEATLTRQAERVNLACTVQLAIRLQPDLFQPAKQITQSDGSIDFVRDEEEPWVEVGLGATTFAIDHTGQITVTGGIGFHIDDPILFGETGVVIESADAEFNFDGLGSRPIGVPQNWKGLYLQNASVRIPKIFPGAIVANGLGLGSGGISGDIGWAGTATYNTSTGKFDGTGAGQLFGLPFGLRSLSLSFQQNIPAGSSINGGIKLPFFDHPVDVDIGFAADGGLTVGIADPTGLAKLSIP